MAYYVFRDKVELGCFDNEFQAQEFFLKAIDEEKELIKGQKDVVVLFEIKQSKTGGIFIARTVSC